MGDTWAVRLDDPRIDVAGVFGTTTARVTNLGLADAHAAVRVFGSPPEAGFWFAVDPPDQSVAAGQTVAFSLKVEPTRDDPGEFSFQLVVFDRDRPDDGVLRSAVFPLVIGPPNWALRPDAPVFEVDVYAEQWIRLIDASAPLGATARLDVQLLWYDDLAEPFDPAHPDLTVDLFVFEPERTFGQAPERFAVEVRPPDEVTLPPLLVLRATLVEDGAPRATCDLPVVFTAPRLPDPGVE